jgi:hypothetical protein
MTKQLRIASADRIPCFCIGAQRAATTYLYELLKARTNAHLSHLKEVHYFDVDSNDSIHFYHSCFPSLENAVDITPSYSVKRKRLSRICRYNPDAKILLIKRDPAERIVSHYIYYKDRYPGVGTFESFLLNNTDDCIGRCAYGSIANEATSLFGSKNFISIEYADLTKNPEKSLKQVADFYGLCVVKKEHVKSKERLVNKSGGVRSSYVFQGIRSIYRSLPFTVPYQLKAKIVHGLDQVHNKLAINPSVQDAQDLPNMKNLAQHYLTSNDVEQFWDN